VAYQTETCPVKTINPEICVYSKVGFPDLKSVFQGASGERKSPRSATGSGESRTGERETRIGGEEKSTREKTGKKLNFGTKMSLTHIKQCLL